MTTKTPKFIKRIQYEIQKKNLSSDIDIVSPEFIQNPHKFCSMLRDKSSIYYLTKEKAWFVMDYDHVAIVLSQGDKFSTAPYKDYDDVLLGAEPPEHNRIRRDILNEYFSNQRVLKLREIAEYHTQSLLAEIKKGKEFDLFKDVAQPLMNQISGSFLGLNPERMGEIVSIGKQLKKYQSREVLKPFLTGQGILQEIYEDGRLSETEIINIIPLFLAGAIGSPQKALCNGFYVLLSYPEIMTQVANNSDLVPSLIKELIRLEPINLGIPRMTRKEIQLGSVKIPSGCTIYASIPAANRDPKKFEQPNKIILDRKSPKPLIFGLGAHQCIGRHIATLQLQVIMKALLTQLPSFKSVESLTNIKFTGHLFERGIKELKLIFN